MAYIYILALFIFTISSAQETYWTGGGGAGNNTLSDPNNWSNGPPTENSIVKINDTTCNNCDIMVDKDMTIAALHLDAFTSSGPNFIISGANLTITTAFTLGTANPTTYYSTGVSLEKGGILELGKDCVATIYYVGSNPISSSYQEDNWFVNRGNITVLGNGAITAGSYVSIDIGDGSSYPLYIENYGTWNVVTGLVRLRFYYLASFDIFGGSFAGTFLDTTSTTYYPTIEFYATNVVLQPGAEAVTFEGATYFNSYYSQSNTDFNSAGSEPNTLIFNTTGVTVSNAWFDSTNIVFLFEGSLADCNITSNGLVNSSSTVTGVVAHFVGNNILQDAIVAGYESDFTVQVDEGATVTMNSVFNLIGTITVLNYGTWIYDSSSSLYFDVQAYWINLGLMQVVNHANDYIYGTSFPGLSTATDAGTMANMGTIEFTNGGGLDFVAGTGTFLQCSKGILKFGWGYPAAGNYPGVSTLPDCTLDGYVGLSYASDSDVPTDGTSIFTFVTKDGSAFSGSLETTSANVLDPLVCVDKTTTAGGDGYVRIYDAVTQKLTCPSGATQILIPTLSGDACSNLPAKIKALEDKATCSVDKKGGCGVDTGTPSGNGNNPASGNVHVVSLAFLVSLACLLLKF